MLMKTLLISLKLVTAVLLPVSVCVAQSTFGGFGGFGDNSDGSFTDVFGEDRGEFYSDLQYLRDRLGEVNVSTSSILAGSEYEALIIDADRIVSKYPGSAEAYGWRGIIKYYYRNTLDDVSSLAMAESARNDLETAISLDPNALEGQPYTMLGSLYLSSPIWPTGFGDEERAGTLLKQGLSLGGETLQANYAYARYLIRIGDIEQARSYLEAALRAPSTPGNEAAEIYVREDISDLLSELTP